MTTVDRTAWLTERRTGVGASDVAGIVGVSPWASPWSVWADKCGLTPLDDDGSAEMTFGQDLEPVIATWFHRQTGLHVAGEQTVVHHTDFDHHFATVDGFATETPDPDIGAPLGVVEMKYAAEVWDVIPDHYRIQVQWQLHCAELERAWLAVMFLPFGRPRFEVFEIDRDQQRIDGLVDAVNAFWTDHVVAGVAPFADDHKETTNTIRALWGTMATEQLPTVALDDHLDTIVELVDLRARASDLKRRITGLENELKAVFGARGPALSEGTLAGELAVSWRAQSQSRVDPAAVRADHGDRYDTTSTFRVLRIHGGAP